MKTNVFLKLFCLRRIFILIFLIISFSSAQAQISLSGRLTGQPEGKPLKGGNLILERTTLTAITDSAGHYTFQGVKPGKYLLKASFMGYQTIRKELFLTRDTLVSLEMQVSVILGEETNIVATKVQPRTPATFSSIDAREISKVNLGNDLTYILQATPSVTVTSDAGTGIGYTGISIRGSDLTRINVTLNGIPINDSETQGVWFVDLPDLASSTGNIQVQRGVGTSTNGPGAFGATINIQTLTLSRDPFAELNTSGGSFNTLKSTLRFGTGMMKEHFSVEGRASWLTSDGYIDRASSKLKSFYLSGGYFGRNTTLKLNILSGQEKTYQAWEGVPKDSLATNRTYNPAGEYKDKSGNIKYYDNQTDNYQQDHYQVIFSQKIGKAIDLNTAFNFTKGRGYYENYKPGQSFGSYGLENVVIGTDTIKKCDMINRKYLDNDFYCLTFSGNYKKNDQLTVTLGGAWSHYFGEHYGRVIWAEYASNGDISRDWYYNTGKKKDFNIFVKGNLRVIKQINVFADLQYRYVNYDISGVLDNLLPIGQVHDFNFFNPKAGIYAEITNHHSLYFSFGIANREPNRNNYEVADRDHMPSPERLCDYELGYYLKLKNFNAGINLYYMNYRDQLVLTGMINNVGEAIMTNVPRSYRAGVEIVAGAIPFRWLEWNLTTTLSRNRIRSFTEYVDEYDSNYTFLGQASKDLGETSLSFSPSLLLTNQFTFRPAGSLYFTLTSKYTGEQYIDNTSSENRMLKAYFTNGITAGYTLKTRWIREIGIILSVNNIFSTRYESNAWVYRYLVDGVPNEANGYFPQALINFLAGITIKI